MKECSIVLYVQQGARMDTSQGSPAPLAPEKDPGTVVIEVIRNCGDHTASEEWRRPGPPTNPTSLWRSSVPVTRVR